MTTNPILIILAGGKSERMGTPKGLLPYKNTYWILEQINRFVKNGTVFIGLGYDYQSYFEAIPWFQKATEHPQKYHDKNVSVVVNHQPKYGLFSTLHSVLKGSASINEVLILPIDVPLFSSSEINKILRIKNQVVMPVFKNKKGHPVKLSAQFCEKLLKIDVSDENARLDVQINQLNKATISLVEVDDSSILKNLNTQKEWDEFLLLDS